MTPRRRSPPDCLSPSQIDVSWTGSTSSDVAEYRIYRSTSGTPTLYQTVTGSPYHDTGLSAGTTYSYQISAVDAAGNEGSKTALAAKSTGGQIAGVPYGPFHMFANTTSLQSTGVDHFNLDHSYAPPSGLKARIDAARDKGVKLVLTIPGSSHSPWKDASGNFNMELWKAGVRSFYNDINVQAVADGVADGTIVGNSVMDEPNADDWCGNGCMTKMQMDEMCGYVKERFPTLPAGPTVVHWWKEGIGTHPDQLPRQTYQVCDFIQDQYDWWQPPNGPGTGTGQGNIVGWKNAAMTAAARNGISIAFSMNLINGGTQDLVAPWTCPNSAPGSQSPNCWMSPTQVRDWGKLLGEVGCWVMMWEYRSSFMTKQENALAFRDVKADLDTRTAHACRRTS